MQPAVKLQNVKLEINVRSKEIKSTAISINIKLEPLVEKLSSRLEESKEKVFSKMGFVAEMPPIKVDIFDTKGYNSASGAAIGVCAACLHDSGHVLLDAEAILQDVVSDTLSSGRGKLFNDPKKLQEFVEVMSNEYVVHVFAHEFTHLNHRFHVPWFFERFEDWRIFDLGMGGFLNKKSLVAKLNRDQAVVEGVACWTSYEIRKENAAGWVETELSARGINETRFKYNHLRIVSKGPTLKEKLRMAFSKDEINNPTLTHGFGSWFVGQVEKALGGNPIKAIVENPPTGVFSILNPERYVKKLKAGKIEQEHVNYTIYEY